MPWIEHPDHPHAEWQKVLEAGGTRLGYRLWVAKLLQVDEEALDLPRYEPDCPWIRAEEITWEKTGNPEIDEGARLKAVGGIQIGPLPMHLEAIAVIDDPKEGQVAAPGSFSEDDLEALQGMASSSFRTIEIDGRDYVLVATPYGR
ncbi:hypothetical protein LAZ40_01450 [Cereibacter sphaeroides]|uniref:hypothetical protein n=1 Tax=Cereibacter sphaeroides TaxID=1063 RepID=UPI001F2056F7|nr:hypothetical protein [Cereibacter sphaeroides]MCE6957725.1 hypothetical protein [Cereibacter sphaeroides]MCE6971511.1 hypothetical protein [Cereibacter sphaeroides]